MFSNLSFFYSDIDAVFYISNLMKMNSPQHSDNLPACGWQEMYSRTCLKRNLLHCFSKKTPQKWSILLTFEAL